MRSAILGIVAYGAWDSIPEEYRGYAVLGVCLILIGYINQVTNAVKTVWKVGRFTSKVARTIVTTPIRFIHYICTANNEIKHLRQSLIRSNNDNDTLNANIETERETTDKIFEKHHINNTTLTLIKEELGIFNNDKLLQEIKKRRKDALEFRQDLLTILNLNKADRSDKDILDTIKGTLEEFRIVKNTLSLVKEALGCKPGDDVFAIAKMTKNVADANNIFGSIDLKNEKFKIIKEDTSHTLEEEMVDTTIVLDLSKETLKNIGKETIIEKTKKLIHKAYDQKTKLNIIISGTTQNNNARFYFTKEEQVTDSVKHKLLTYITEICEYQSLQICNADKSKIVNGIKRAVWLKVKHITLINKIQDSEVNNFLAYMQSQKTQPIFAYA